MDSISTEERAIPEPYGEVAVSTPCYALVTAELARGWVSLACNVIVRQLVRRGGLG